MRFSGFSERIESDFTWCMQVSRCWDDNAELGCCLICTFTSRCLALVPFSIRSSLSSYQAFKSSFSEYIFHQILFHSMSSLFSNIFSYHLFTLRSAHVKECGGGKAWLFSRGRAGAAAWQGRLAACKSLVHRSSRLLMDVISVVQIHSEVMLIWDWNHFGSSLEQFGSGLQSPRVMLIVILKPPLALAMTLNWQINWFIMQRKKAPHKLQFAWLSRHQDKPLEVTRDNFV